MKNIQCSIREETQISFFLLEYSCANSPNIVRDDLCLKRHISRDVRVNTLERKSTVQSCAQKMCRQKREKSQRVPVFLVCNKTKTQKHKKREEKKANKQTKNKKKMQERQTRNNTTFDTKTLERKKRHASSHRYASW